VLTSTIPPRELALSGDLVPLLGGARAAAGDLVPPLGEAHAVAGGSRDTAWGAHATGIGVLVGARQSSGTVGRARQHRARQGTTSA
jgi:hypothetical protein